MSDGNKFKPEGKKPWEPGFKYEEHDQKRRLREHRGDKDIIKDFVPEKDA